MERESVSQPAKTVTINKNEAKWHCGIWLGTIEHTNEHIIGTMDGVVKCRAIAPLPEDKQYDAVFSERVKWAPWKPSAKHNGWKIKTNLGGEEDEIDEVNLDYEVPVDYNEDADEAKRIIR